MCTHVPSSLKYRTHILAPLGDDVTSSSQSRIPGIMLGTGLSRAVEPGGEVDRAIAAIEGERSRGARVLAVDVPSGLDSDTGQPLGACVRWGVGSGCCWAQFWCHRFAISWIF